MSFEIIGLDIETSTNDPNTGEILQLGIAYQKDGVIIDHEYNLKYEKSYWNVNNWSLESERVHKIRKKELESNTFDYKLLEIEIINLFNNIFSKETVLHPVGFNLGGFDLVFIKNKMPKVAERISHRVIDLNSLFITMNLEYKSEELFIKNKKEKIEKVLNNIDNNKLHNASFDAKLALLLCKNFKVSYNL